MRTRKVLARSFALASLIAIAFLFSMGIPASRTLVDAEQLEAAAKNRFSSMRGLSPCEPYARDVVSGALNKLIAEGFGQVDLIGVVAPTFDDIEIIIFSESGIESYRMKGQTGFTPPTAQWFSGQMQLISKVDMTPTQQYNVLATFKRSVQYAMTAREFGLDGTSYFLGNGEDLCAFTSHPREEGSAALITQILQEAASPQPGVQDIVKLAAAVDAFDASP